MNHVPVLLALVLLGLFPDSAGAATQAERESIASLGCAACHDDLKSAGLRAAPDLRMSIGNVRPEFMVSLMMVPHSVNPDTRMPDLVASLPDSERVVAAVELSAFLASVAAERDEPAELDWGDPEKSRRRGERLYHEVGCVMCHGVQRTGKASPTDPGPTSDMRSLDGVMAKYTPRGLARFLGDPLAHRPAGLMPNMHLNRGEARDLAGYLTFVPENSVVSITAATAPFDEELVESGRQRFRALGCANCHSGLDDAPVKGAGPARNDPSGGCLSEDPPAGVPQYRFTDEERSALRDAMALLDQERSPTEQVANSLAAFRCTACHDRNGSGGVPAHLDDFLVTDEPDLGEHARRPPHLDGVGGKLRRAWLERVLYDGASVRPYMHTRMPMFGEDNLAHLPDLLEEVDAQPPLELPKVEGDEERPTREAAQKLLGVTGLGCVSCHSFNAQRGPNFQGMDLITMPERLRERWFRDFLVAPQSLLPGVIMPESWSGGVAAYDGLLDGDTDQQIAAIWHFLRLGRSARNPIGIAQPNWNVDVAERPMVYRGRSRVAGFRGIAVGFPEGIHFAFDANNGAMAGLWRGDFVSVNWNGQGAGDFSPRSQATELPRDVALLADLDEAAAWPLRPITTEEEPINADPTYPRRLGYRFRGYHLDPEGYPTLRYSLGDVMVEDRAAPRVVDGRTTLSRGLTLETQAAARLTFRALAGEIESSAPGEYRVGSLLLRVPADSTFGAARLRPWDEGQELLIDLDLPVGRTQLELNYDLVD